MYEAVELMVADEYQAALKKIEEAEVEQCELKHVHEKTVEKVICLWKMNCGILRRYFR